MKPRQRGGAIDRWHATVAADAVDEGAAQVRIEARYSDGVRSSRAYRIESVSGMSGVKMSRAVPRSTTLLARPAGVGPDALGIGNPEPDEDGHVSLPSSFTIDIARNRLHVIDSANHGFSASISRRWPR